MTQIARVQLPDGRVARLEVPDGATPEQIESFVFNNINKPQSAAARDTAKFEEKIRSETAPGALARVGRGFMDVGQGVKQGYLRVKDLLTAPSFTDLITGTRESDRYTREVDDEIARYERGRGPDAGIDWMRLGGNIAATAPAMLVPGGAAASLPVRMLSGAAGGGAASAAMFTPEGESKAGQIALGTLFGGAAPAGFEVVKRAAAPVVRKVSELVRGPAAQNLPALAGEIEIKLQAQGVDWNKLTQTVKDSLLKDAQGALAAGGTLDDAMLKNKALIESVGATPTRASVTRAPRDWQTEKNLRGIQGVGDEIVTREQENARAMVDYLGRLRTQSGGKTSTAVETGESAVGAIRAADKAKEKVVDDLYAAYRSSGAKDALVPETKLTEALTKIIDEVGLDNVPPAVQARLKNFGFLGGERTRNLTVMEADTFNKLLNANRPAAGGGVKAVGMLQSALNKSLLDVPLENKAGAEALIKARAAASQRFTEQEAGSGIAAAIDDVHPDKFVQRFIVSAPARDMKATLAELAKTPQGAQSIADIKGHVLDSLLLKATGRTNIDDVAGSAFSGAKFGKALDAIEPEKLHALFKPAELESLRTLQKASKLLTEEVAFSDVNYSKTTSALANLFLKIGNTPLLGKLVSPIIGTAKVGMDWVKDATARKQVAEALVGSATRAAERPKLPVYPIERLAPGAAGTLAYQAGSE